MGGSHITVCCVLAPSLPGGPEHKLVRSKAKELKGNACSCRVDGAQVAGGSGGTGAAGRLANGACAAIFHEPQASIHSTQCSISQHPPLTWETDGTTYSFGFIQKGLFGLELLGNCS